MKCNQCCASVVSYGQYRNVFLHEKGCPNDGATWDTERQDWIHTYDCDICGYPVEVGTTCTCYSDHQIDDSNGNNGSTLFP
jgi:hypothetical protein